MEPILAHRPAGWRPRADFLLAPLGWTLDRLGNAIATTPALLESLVAIDKPRMHLVAFALAHRDGEITPDLAAVLLRGPHKTVLDLSLGQRPAGLCRVFAHLPSEVLAAENYRNLVALLSDPATAKRLHHSPAIDEATITTLHALPAPLRQPAIMLILDEVHPANGFVDGLRFLAPRVEVPFDALATRLGSFNQPKQIVAEIRRLVDTLPCPDSSLPVRIGSFRRVDSVAEIRAIAQTWQNCLGDQLDNVNEGTSAIYLSEQMNAACLCSRLGRLGWFLVDAKGPKNAALAPHRLAQIHDAFAAANIPDAAVTRALYFLTDEWMCRGLPGD